MVFSVLAQEVLLAGKTLPGSLDFSVPFSHEHASSINFGEGAEILKIIIALS